MSARKYSAIPAIGLSYCPGMSKHEIQLTLPAVPLKNTDLEVIVYSDGARLGVVKISKGTLDWLPSKNSKNHFVMNWERFAQIMVEHGTQKAK